LNLGVHLGLEVISSLKKQEIRNVVAIKLLPENIFTTYDFPTLEQSGMSEIEFQISYGKIKIYEPRKRSSRERKRTKKST
jgi:hypothetical protein